MKEMRRLINGLVGCGIALAMVSTLMAQTTSEGSAKVVRVKGIARYMMPGGSWQPLTAGQVLQPGAIVQTGKSSRDKDGYVDIAINEPNASVPRPAVFKPSIPSSTITYQPSASQNVVRIWQDSALGIDKLTSMSSGTGDPVTETQLDLRKGRITGNVKKLSAGSRYEIKLPNGVAGIRGTFFDITADGVVKVFDGSLVIATVNADGTTTTQVVIGGQMYNAQTNTLSPLSASDRMEQSALAPSMRYVQAPPPVGVPVDKTVYFNMSPTQGR